MKLNLIFFLMTVCWGVLLPPRRLLETLVTSHIVLPPGKILSISKINSGTFQGPTAEGVQMNVIDSAFDDLTVSAQLQRVQSAVSFPIDQEFVDEIARVFSNPLVTRVVFNQWTKDRVLLKRASDGPDEVEAQLTNETGQLILVRFQLTWKKPDTPLYCFQFLKFFSGPFKISAENLKQTLDHISRKDFPLWRAEQIVSSLAVSSGMKGFDIYLPNNSQDVAKADRDTFEYSYGHFKVVRERFDQETQMDEKFSEDFEGRRFLTYSDQKAQSITFEMEKDAFRPIGFVYFMITRTCLEIQSFSEATLARIFARLSGIRVPLPLLKQWREKLVLENSFKVRLSLFASVDLAIWQLMGTLPPRD